MVGQDSRAPEVAVVWCETWGHETEERRRPRRWLLPLAALMTALVMAQAPSARGPSRDEVGVLPGAATAPIAPSGPTAPSGPGSVAVDVGRACVTIPSAIPNIDLAADAGGLIWTRADAVAAAGENGPNIELPRDPVGLRSSGADPACSV